ncbi:MAG: Gfo/Idh/MocA family oxidoreductase [Clostridia bacterium]
MGKDVITFGIIGCGVISNWHAQAIAEIEGARLKGVTDVFEPARIAFAEKYSVSAYDSAEALLADPEIDAVCICTPSGLHAPLAISAANAGKNIVVEKPMALTHEEIAEVLAACEKNHVKMSVISQLRFSKAIRALKGAIDAGELGKIVLADLSMKFFRSQEYYDKGGWRGTWKMDGGGALMNQGIHGIDMLQYVMGRVKSVSAITRTLARKIEVEDTAVAILEFENGALGQIVGTTSIYPGSSRTLEICGDHGTIKLTEDAITEWEIEGKEQPKNVLNGGAGSDTSSDPTNFSISGHVEQLTDMVDAIKNDRLPFINQFDGRLPVEIILAIYESSKTGKTVNL